MSSGIGTNTVGNKTKKFNLNTKEMVKTFLKLEALFVPLYFSFVMYYTFLSAYYNPTPLNMMWIDSFGEAKFEFVLIPLCLLFSVAGVILWLTEEIKKRNPSDVTTTNP